jgi:hypothetical protein
MVNAAGNGLQYGYDIGLLDTIDKGVRGVLDVGPYPHELVFSPDDQIAYAVHTTEEIDVYNVATSEHLDTWYFPPPYEGRANELITDRTGRFLFAAASFDNLLVFATGRQVIPEPSSSALFIVGLAVASITRRGPRPTLSRRPLGSPHHKTAQFGIDAQRAASTPNGHVEPMTSPEIAPVPLFFQVQKRHGGTYARFTLRSMRRRASCNGYWRYQRDRDHF